MLQSLLYSQPRSAGDIIKRPEDGKQAFEQIKQLLVSSAVLAHP